MTAYTLDQGLADLSATGYSVSDLAREAGVSAAAVYDARRGRYRLKTKTLRKIELAIERLAERREDELLNVAAIGAKERRQT
jgi:hypothetical protein